MGVGVENGVRNDNGGLEVVRVKNSLRRGRAGLEMGFSPFGLEVSTHPLSYSPYDGVSRVDLKPHRNVTLLSVFHDALFSLPRRSYNRVRKELTQIKDGFEMMTGYEFGENSKDKY